MKKLHDGQTCIYMTLDTRYKLNVALNTLNAWALTNGLRKRRTGPPISQGDLVEALLASADLDDVADHLQNFGLKK